MGMEFKCVKVVDRMTFCCCNCTLRTGALIIGWLKMVSAVSTLAMGLLKLDYMEEPQTPYETKPIIISTVVSGAVGILIVGLLLYGINTERPEFMLVFVIVDMIGNIVLFLFVGVLFVNVYHQNVGMAALLFVLGGLMLVVAWYFWLVVYSYYRELVTRQESCPNVHVDNFVAVEQNEAEPKPYYEFRHQNQPGQETA